jgi:hypothetical protein
VQIATSAVQNARDQTWLRLDLMRMLQADGCGENPDIDASYFLGQRRLASKYLQCGKGSEINNAWHSKIKQVTVSSI